MSWLDTLLPASFAGVPFFVENGSSGECGRRLQINQIPFSDRYNLSDLGQLNQPISIPGFLLDEDGDLHRKHKEFIAALNNGEGVLVHPREGVIRAIPGRCSFSFDGGQVRYQLQFMPPPSQSFDEQIETSTRVSSQSDQTVAVTSADSAQALDVSEAGLLEDVQNTVGQALDTLQSANAQVDATLAPATALGLQVKLLGNELAEVIRTPIKLFDAVNGMYRDLLASAESVSDALERYRNAKPSIEPVTNIQTPTQQIRATNRNAVDAGFTVAIVAQAIRFVALNSAELNVTSNEQSPFDSFQHALSVRDELLNDLDAALNLVGGSAFDQLIALRSEFFNHIDAHGIRLPRVTEIKYGIALPAWVIAHDVYGDVNQMSDLVRRNSLFDPVRVEAGTKLEVLRNA